MVEQLNSVGFGEATRCNAWANRIRLNSTCQGNIPQGSVLSSDFLSTVHRDPKKQAENCLSCHNSQLDLWPRGSFMWMSVNFCLDYDFNFVNRQVNFHALISLVESSGDWWQTHLVVLVFRTWHLYDWRRLNGSNISLRSYPLSPSLSAAVIGYQSFVVETIAVAIKEARWKEVSILTSVHLSRPLSLCLPRSLWFHISRFYWTMNRATCSQKPEFSELVISWTAGITRQHLTVVMKTRGASVSFLFKPCPQFFPAHLWTPDSRVWYSCVSVWYCQPCRNQSVTNLSPSGTNTIDFLALRQLWSCQNETKCALVLKLIFKRVKRRILSDSPPYFKILFHGRVGVQCMYPAYMDFLMHTSSSGLWRMWL